MYDLWGGGILYFCTKYGEFSRDKAFSTNYGEIHVMEAQITESSLYNVNLTCLVKRTALLNFAR